LRRTNDGFDAALSGGGSAIDIVPAPGLKLAESRRTGDRVSASFVRCS
jgi:glycerate-2-kinase